MAKLFTGIQGSGKSYKAMHEIATSKEKYYRVYSNLDKLVNTRTIFSLDFNTFVAYGLKECFKIMVTNNRDMEIDESLTDDEIFNMITTQKISYDDAIAHLQKIKLLPSVVNEDNRVLMIIDEAQDYFGKSAKLSPELIWFITQHRHLYIEVILLTQDVSLIRSDYKLFNEIYDATPPSLQVDKRYFSYHQYVALPLGEGTYVGKIKLKREPKIFAMYKSGDKVESPNVFKRFILMGIGAIALIAGSSWILGDTFGNKTKEASQNSTVKIITDLNATKKKTIYTDSDYAEFVYLKINCIKYTCSNDARNISLYIDDLKDVTMNTNSKILGVKKYSSNLAMITVLASSDFINLFQGAKQDGKKNTKGFSIID